MENFKLFVKYNPHLVTVNLESTGMAANVVKDFGHILTRAQGLRCLHLGGNVGVTEESIKYLAKRIKGKRLAPPCPIVAPKKQIELIVH